MQEQGKEPALPAPGTLAGWQPSPKANQKIVIALTAAALLLIAVTAASLWAFRQIETSSEARRHTAAVIASAHSFLSELRDAETAERGYALTGDPAFLEPYNATFRSIGAHLADLRARTKLLPAHERLDAVLPLVDAKLAELAQVIELRGRNDLPGVIALVGSGSGKRLMESIRAEMNRFVALEETLLAQQGRQFDSNMTRLFAIIVTTCLFALLLALAFSYLVYREANNRVRNLVHLETKHLLGAQEETNRLLIEANATLKDSAALVQTILDNVADGIITIHASGGIIDSSNAAAQRMFGYGAEELVGRSFSLLIPELDQDLHGGSLEYYSASDSARAAGLGREVSGRRKDGSTFQVELGASELQLGGTRYFTGILRDITARNRTDAALKDRSAELESARSVADKANRAKTEFLSGMSHELRTPLNAILGFAQLLESGTPAPTPVQKRSLDQILKAGWYLLELINEILDLAMIESGRVTMSREPVSLVEVMLECRAMIEPQAVKRGISMRFPSFGAPTFVNADRTRLKQVLINLLFNAIKYNKPHGSVTVEVAPGGTGMVRISVRDTGAGLATEQLAQLFQPFNRIGKEASAEEGTGIGLVVTKRLVELMDGTIGVESFVGVGSVFWVELHGVTAPRRVVPESELRAIDRPSAPAGTPTRSVLYVEDNPANLELVEQLIARRSELRLLSAADGELGIEFARAYQPSVILMDINLPGMSGLEAMQVLRLDPATSHIPVIALSANAVPSDIERALEAGFFNYLTKPIKVEQLMDALDAALMHARTAQPGDA